MARCLLNKTLIVIVEIAIVSPSLWACFEWSKYVLLERKQVEFSKPQECNPFKFEISNLKSTKELCWLHAAEDGVTLKITTYRNRIVPAR